MNNNEGEGKVFIKSKLKKERMVLNILGLAKHEEPPNFFTVRLKAGYLQWNRLQSAWGLSEMVKKIQRERSKKHPAMKMERRQSELRDSRERSTEWYDRNYLKYK